MFQDIKKPDAKWSDVTDIFSCILDNEQFIYDEAKELYIFAQKINDSAAAEFVLKILETKSKNLSQSKQLVYKMIMK